MASCLTCRCPRSGADLDSPALRVRGVRRGAALRQARLPRAARSHRRPPSSLCGVREEPAMNRRILAVSAVVLVILAIFATSSLFIVDQTEEALVLQFGQP